MFVYNSGTVPADESIINVDLTSSRYPDAPEVGEIDFPEVDNMESVTIQYRPSDEDPFQNVEIKGKTVTISYCHLTKLGKAFFKQGRILCNCLGPHISKQHFTC